MTQVMTQQQERENCIAALVMATSRITRALVIIRKQIPHFEAHPLIGSLTARNVELGNELLWLDNEFNNVIKGGGTIAPPDNDRLEEISRIAREVDEMIRNAQAADALLDAANAAIKLANDVKKAAP